MKQLRRSFLGRPAVEVAPELLNKVIACEGVSARIVEVEAYEGSSDPASHAFRGRTARTSTMFGKPGLLYVYFTYGMHFCMNVVCGREGLASAVLLRAGEPLTGEDLVSIRRPAARKPSELMSGPARLCQAMAIDREDDGNDLLDPTSRVTLGDDGCPPPAAPGRGSRAGIKAAQDFPWRWWSPGNANVSKAKGSSSIRVFD